MRPLGTGPARFPPLTPRRPWIAESSSSCLSDSVAPSHLAPRSQPGLVLPHVPPVELPSCSLPVALPRMAWPEGSLSPAADTAPALLTPWLHILPREESAAGSWLLLALHPRFPPAPHPASRPQSTLIHPGNTSGLYLPRPWGPFPCITFPWPCRSLYTFFPWKAHLHPPQHLRPLSLLLPGFFLLSHLCWRPSPTRLSAPVGGP